ncbi:MAG: hypothetical protein ACFCUN_05750 [Hyphomicrobiaceae bacterium]
MSETLNTTPEPVAATRPAKRRGVGTVNGLVGVLLALMSTVAVAGYSELRHSGDTAKRVEAVHQSVAHCTRTHVRTTPAI